MSEWLSAGDDRDVHLYQHLKAVEISQLVFVQLQVGRSGEKVSQELEIGIEKTQVAWWKPQYYHFVKPAPLCADTKLCDTFHFAYIHSIISMKPLLLQRCLEPKPVDTLARNRHTRTDSPSMELFSS